MNGTEETEVTLESIDGALAALVKAAGATDLVKAYGGTAVDQYGHVDERGKTSGGLAGKGDMGGLDSMMIGKMETALIDAGIPAEAIAAFMGGKDKDKDEDEELEGKMGKPADTSGSVATNPRVSASGGTVGKMKDDDDGEGKGKGKGNPFGKSYDAFAADPAIADAIDVSPFLEALVQRTSEQLDGLSKSQFSQVGEQQEVNKTTAAAVYGIGQLIKGMAPILDALNNRLSLVERQPTAPRGAQSVPQAQAMAKSFAGQGAGQPQQTQLHKGQVCSVLTFMNLEKGIKTIGGRSTSELASLYEGGGQLAPQTFHAVQRFLATNPGEVETALTYA
jgi:hypothetical protein